MLCYYLFHFIFPFLFFFFVFFFFFAECDDWNLVTSFRTLNVQVRYNIVHWENFLQLSFSDKHFVKMWANYFSLRIIHLDSFPDSVLLFLMFRRY